MSGKSERCANCGMSAGPRFCPHCGQELEARQGPFGAAIRELLSDVASLDSRMLRSLVALIRPGRLSELYLAGKRAPFLRPMRLYLLASLVVFSTILALDTPSLSDDIDVFIGGELLSPGQGIPTDEAAPADTAGADSGSSAKVNRSLQLLSDKTWLQQQMIDLYGLRIESLKQLPRHEILGSLFSGLRRMLPLTLILFVPFLALALKLLYIRKRGKRSLYLEHLVFSLHFQAALFFALATVWGVSRVLGLELLASALVYGLTVLGMILIYLPLALSRVYRQSWAKTAIKSLALLFMYLQLLSIAISHAVIFALRSA